MDTARRRGTTGSLQDADRALRVRSVAQSGAFSLDQARSCGLSARTIHRRTETGRYERVAQGVFVDSAVPATARRDRVVALLSVGREAAIARHTAGRMWDLDSAPPTDEVHLVVTCTCPHGRAGIRVHRSRTLAADHVTELDGLPVTTPARTIADLADACGPTRLRRLVAQAVRQDLTTAAELRAIMDDMGRFRGKAALRELVDELSPLASVARSALESEFLALTSAAGVAPSALNHEVVDADGTTRFLDAVWQPEGLAAELDSRLAHGSLLDWHDDQRRENAVVIAGYGPILRFNWHDVTKKGHVVVATIRRALRELRPR